MNLLQCVGIAIVAANKESDTDEIFVYAPTIHPTAEGKVSAGVEEVQRTTLGLDQEPDTTTSLQSNAIPAIWMNTGDNNRITPPDVREGSKVALYKVSGENLYRWTTFGVNATTYRLETVIHGFNANPNTTENSEFDINNFYIFKVSTHEGLVAFRTTQLNGEATKFDLQLDLMEGEFSISGDNGSYLVLDDVEQSLTYTNANETVFSVDKEVGTFYSKDTLNLFTDNKMFLKTELLNVQAKHLQVDVPLTEWKGLIKHFGNMEQTGNLERLGTSQQVGNAAVVGSIGVTGGAGGGGNLTTSGGIDAEGAIKSLKDITTPADVKAGAISLKTHRTSGVKSGGDTSSTPIP